MRAWFSPESPNFFEIVTLALTARAAGSEIVCGFALDVPNRNLLYRIAVTAGRQSMAQLLQNFESVDPKDYD